MTSSNRNDSKTIQPAANWTFPLVVGLSIGISIPVARAIAESLCPGQDVFWSKVAVGATAAGCIGGIVASVIVGLFKLFGIGKPALPSNPR